MSELPFIELVVPQTRQLDGSKTIEVSENKAVEIAYWAPGKINLMDMVVPPGKHWQVSITVHIEETDA